MNFATLKASIPDYAKDLRLNLDSVLIETGAPGLTLKQIHAVALASAIASRYAPLTEAIDALVMATLDEAERNAVRAAAAIMGMTNIYYRATHLIANNEYASLRTSLRMNALANPALEKAAFELATLAVSAINGCGACLDAHEKVLRQHGVSAQGVQSALRIAAVTHATAVTLEQAAAQASATTAAA